LPGSQAWPLLVQLASAQPLSVRPVFSLPVFSLQPVWPQAWQPVWRQRFSLLAWRLVLLPVSRRLWRLPVWLPLLRRAWRRRFSRQVLLQFWQQAWPRLSQAL
jgi:hypothetical protein